jgi:hypothetical protein
MESLTKQAMPNQSDNRGKLTRSSERWQLWLGNARAFFGFRSGSVFPSPLASPNSASEVRSNAVPKPRREALAGSRHSTAGVDSSSGEARDIARILERWRASLSE